MEGIDKVQGKRKKTRPPRGAALRGVRCPKEFNRLLVNFRKELKLHKVDSPLA
jgi:hypothetical protein